MIVSRIMGGLGNQMLQYAVGRSLAVEKKIEPLRIDLSWYCNNKNVPFFREFELNKFNTTYKTIDHKSIIWKLRFTNHFKTLNPFKYEDVSEKEYATFNHSIFECGSNILLQGLFPSYKYFNRIRKTLQAELVPKQTMDCANLATLAKIKSVNSVSVHFRRGDYALTGFHHILDKSYYKRAIDYLSAHIQNIQLFIFSDEPEWVAQNFHFELPCHIMDINNGDRSYLDLELMKNCKHNIIANSTFSWWAAWLNPNLEKIVVGPRNWLNNVDINRMQNVPEEWILV